MRTIRNAAVRLITAGALMALAGGTGAQPLYPSKPVRIIVSYATGNSLDVLARLVGQGMEPFVSGPEQFAALIRADMAKYARLIKAANIKIE